MLGVFRSEPKYLAVFPGLNLRCLSVRAQMPGGVFMFDCEALSGQKKNSWRFSPGLMRSIYLPEPTSPAVLPNLNAMRLSIRTKLPGDISKSKSKVFVGQNRNPWQYLPVLMRGVCRPETKFLATFTGLNAMCLSVGTKIPGDIAQF